MREMFSKKLVDLVRADANTYLLSGDHGYALFDALRKEKPAHFVNAGVAEQNMIGVGAGMAKVGLYPIMYGLSAFVPIRVLEQIKIDFCYEDLPGLFIGDGAGVVYSHLGTSHQSTEDIAALRAIPNISILSPCDAYELEACFDWAVKQRSPVYLRMGKADLGVVNEKPIERFDSAPRKVHSGSRPDAIYATGSMVKPVQNILRARSIEVDLFSVPVLKNRNEQLNLLRQDYARVLTVEEHSVYGGLGDLLCAEAAVSGGVKVTKVGINDRFSELCGTHQYLMKENGLDPEALERRIGFWLQDL